MVALLHPLSTGKQIPIDRAVVVVGRSPDCDSVLDISSKISRMHCALVQVDKTFHIRDLGSMNGVWVNGKRVDGQQQLQNGDKVAIGDIPFKFYQNVQPASRSTKKVVLADASQQVPVLIDETLPADAIDDVVEVVEVVEDVEFIDDVIELNEQTDAANQGHPLYQADIVEVVDAENGLETVHLKYNSQQGAEAEFIVHNSIEVVDADEQIEVIEDVDIVEDLDVIEDVDVVDDIHVVDDVLDIVAVEDVEVIDDADQIEILDDLDVIEDADIIDDVEVIDEPDPPFKPRPRRRRR